MRVAGCEFGSGIDPTHYDEVVMNGAPGRGNLKKMVEVVWKGALTAGFCYF